MGVMLVSDIEDALRDRVEALARDLLPACVQEGNYLKIGDVQGNAGGSMAIYLKGAKQGKWRDFASDDHGDCLDLIERVEGLASKGDAVRWAKDWLRRQGMDIPEETWGQNSPRMSEAERERRATAARQRAADRAAAEAQDKAAKMLGAKKLFLHKAAVPLAGTPAEAYLRGRGIDAAPWPGSLRFHPEVWNREASVKLPTLLAMGVLPDGSHACTHRIYLHRCPARGWTKIDSPNAKMVLGPMGGAFIPINKGSSGKSMRQMPEGEPVYMTEGLEDAMVVRMARPNLRIVAAISLGNMGAIVFPPACRRLVMVADRDTKPKAIEALERSIAQQQARGMQVDLVMPPPGIKDFNDWLLGLGQQQRGAA